jgi:hypothetical protein
MTEVRKITPDISNERDLALDELFGKVKDTRLLVTDLPSRGKFYEDFKGVTITPLKFLDEQTILNAKDSPQDIVSDLLKQTITGIDVEDLLLIDKSFLLMKLREVSYGDDYEFSVVCPKCNYESKATIMLSKQLNMTQIPKDFDNPRKINLPKLGVEALVRLPRNVEEHLLVDAESIYINLYRFITSLAGHTDPIFISKAVERMEIADVKKLVKEITNIECGINPKFVYKCGKCEHKETLAVPIDSGFFSVS